MVLINCKWFILYIIHIKKTRSNGLYYIFSNWMQMIYILPKNEKQTMRQGQISSRPHLTAAFMILFFILLAFSLFATAL